MPSSPFSWILKRIIFRLDSGAEHLNLSVALAPFSIQQATYLVSLTNGLDYPFEGLSGGHFKILPKIDSLLPF